MSGYQDSSAGRFVDAARFHADITVFNDIDPPVPLRHQARQLRQQDSR